MVVDMQRGNMKEARNVSLLFKLDLVCEGETHFDLEYFHVPFHRWNPSVRINQFLEVEMYFCEISLQQLILHESIRQPLFSAVFSLWTDRNKQGSPTEIRTGLSYSQSRRRFILFCSELKRSLCLIHHVNCRLRRSIETNEVIPKYRQERHIPFLGKWSHTFFMHKASY